MDIITKIETHLEKPYTLEGYEIVRIQLNGMKRKTLQIMIDRLDEQPITLDDCTNVSHLTSMLLDQIDLIDDQYALEVSSTGLDRPLTKPHHYKKCVGQNVSLTTHALIKNRKKFQGRLSAADDGSIVIILTEALIDGSLDVKLSYNDIKNAKIKPDF